MTRSSLLPSAIGWFALALVVCMAIVTTGMTGITSLEAPIQVEPAQDEFIPLDQVPPEDQLPAAPLLVTAYGLIWVVVLGYLWSVSRRMSTVEKELSSLLKQIEERGSETGSRR